MKGGSIASNAVTGLVTEAAYGGLTRNFSNFTNSGKCGGAKTVAKKGGKCKGKCHSGSKRGGSSDVFSSVSKPVVNAVKSALNSSFGNKGTTEGFNVFKSVPAPAGYEYANLRGSNSNSKGPQKTGGMFNASQFKNLSNYMANAGTNVVKNKRSGGAANVEKGNVTIGLNYNAVKNTSKMYGNTSVPRTTPAAVERMMASNSASNMPSLAKATQYGSTTNTAHYFNYAGVDKLAQGGRRKRAKSGTKSKKC